MTKDELRKRFPRASAAFIEANAEGLRAAYAKRPAVVPLERPAQRKDAGRTRAAIRFTCFSRRPADWDNLRFKDLQDLLVIAGILDDDAWDILKGCVESKKAHSAEEERTEISIYVEPN